LVANSAAAIGKATSGASVGVTSRAVEPERRNQSARAGGKGEHWSPLDASARDQQRRASGVSPLGKEDWGHGELL
jgi:hypothetical protein